MSQEPSRRFVGRSTELGALSRHLAAAADGAGRLLLVTGEPGIGKTRLVEHALSRGELPESRVLWGRSRETPGAPAFWPWIQVLRQLVERTPKPALRRALGTGGSEIGRILPEIRGRLADIPPPDASEDTDPNETRFRLFDAIARFLTELPDTHAIVLDDLHWADAESLLLLRFLAPELRRSHLLVVATCREEQMDAPGGPPHILGDLVRVAHRVPLTGLDVKEIGDYVRDSSQDASAAAVEAIQRASGGNPFLVGELVDLLGHEGLLHESRVRLDELALPSGVREAALRRIERIAGEARRLLEIAAVAGPDFEIVVIARAAGLEPGEVVEHLSQPQRERILVSSPASPGRLAFTHGLLGDSIRAGLDHAVRARHHRALADALEAVHARSLDEVAGDIARHDLAAGVLGDPERARRTAIQAGDGAMRRLSFEEAANHYECAARAAQAGDDTPRERLDLLCRRAAALLAGDEDEATRNVAVEAAQLARSLDDVRTEARAAIMAAAARSETTLPDHELIDLLEDASLRLDPADARQRTIVLTACARELYFADRTRSRAVSVAALAAARALGDRLAVAAALGSRHLAIWEPGTAEERLALVSEELAAAEDLQDFPLAMHAHAWRIGDLLELGDISAVSQALARYEALAERRRQPRMIWHVAVARASEALRLGHLDEAERLATSALATWKPGPQNNVLQFYAIQLLLIREEQGRLAEIDTAAQDFASRSNLPAWKVVLAWLHASLGRDDEARRVLGDLRAQGLESLPFDGTWLASMARLAETCALLDDGNLAAELLPRLAPFSRYNVVVGAGVACLGSVARWVGLLAFTAGRHEEAVTALEAALAANRTGRFHAQVAHVQAELARALRRSDCGSDARASELEQEALATARALGLGSLLAETTSDSATNARRGVRPGRPAAAPARPSTRADLRREGEIWTIEHGDEITRVRDMKGMHYLAHLLRHPGKEFHALDIVGSDTGDGSDGDDAVSAAVAPSTGLDERHAQRERLADLREELAEAEEFNDSERCARLRDAMEEIAEEISRASGAGGPRRPGSPAERARLNATRAIRKAIARIEGDCPRLGRHLSSSVLTGRVCVYREDPTFAVTWQL